MPFIEAPTTFYLGRRYNPRTNKLDDDVVYYDSRDLMTHAVVVGMTGSGKTGLSISILEEAILDNIPAIVIDPKGDITNLLLTFPDMRPEDFSPWVNPDAARRSGMDVNMYAADVAQRWKDGLQSWGIVPDRVRWLKLATQYSVYTPGSDTGLPISILASLRAPRQGWAGYEEIHREKINGIANALLALVGMDINSVDKEHVLLANIFENAWRQGVDLTLEDIILQVQKPPFDKLGVFPIDQYISERARSKLAQALNSIIAAPSFQSWLQGQPIDIPSLLRQPNGRPRVSIFYIAHLNDQERMFMITLLLENLLSWMRTQAGTTSLRALLYIDEMFGYFPPYPKNPPTKEPILRLLKQARAFGLGLVLATQNPGDLDYKGLTNAGTWFIGRLQSDSDKQKVMDGLRSLASADEGYNLQDVETLIADIPPRVFLMRNVHETDGPVLLHTRWAMSYLAGPLTRQQISLLMRDQRQQLMQQMALMYGQQQPTAWTQPGAPQGFGQTPPPPPAWGNTPVPGVPQQVPGAPPVPGGFPGMQGGMAAPMPPQNLPPGVPAGLPGYSGQFNAQAAFPTYTQQHNNYQQQIFRQQAAPQQAFAAPPPVPQDSQFSRAVANTPPGFSNNPPPLESSIPQYYLPHRLTAQQALAEWERRSGSVSQNTGASTLVYEPVLLVQAIVRYQDRKANIYTARVYAYHVPGLQRAGLIHWEEYAAEAIEARAVAQQPQQAALYGDLAPGLTDAKRLKDAQTEVVDMLYNTARLAVPFNPTLKVYGNPDAGLEDFQANVEQVAREQRDAELDKLSQKYGTLMGKLEEKLRKEEQELRAEQKELRDRKREELFTTGEALHGLWQGRTAYTLSRMSRATLYRRQTAEDIRESEESLTQVEQEIQAAERQFEQELAAVNDKWARITTQNQEYLVSPYKKDIQLELFGVGWVPSWLAVVNGQPVVVSAF
ncbi:MAG: hypothetical protein OHK0046_08280 [Anaerolineae bacterium]